MKHLILTLSLLMLTSLALSAQNAGELRQRMEARLPAIIELKTEKLVGENNQAYLAALGTLNATQSEVVAAENADRRSVYTMLARQTGAALDLVEKKRAAQLREQAAAGTMIQTESGEWVAK
jgi:uncharacterized protein